MEKRIKILIYITIVLCCAAILVAAIVVSLVKTSGRKTSPYHLANTTCGQVQGKLLEDEVYQFLNIPYTQPPTGELRWRAPQHLKGNTCWKETLPYKDEIVMCPQTDWYSGKVLGREDCLVLSVHTTSVSRDANMPVVVWIHGGGMIAGHSRMPGYYPDSEFTSSMEVVTVSINYRLGVFGFLSLRDLWKSKSGEYGNFAIMDQILALKWVRENIRNFGGNPSDVTIFGESGGGTAVYCLLAASLDSARGLFHKAIASSGAPNVHITKEDAADFYTKEFLPKTNCSTNVEVCLRNMSMEAVMSVMSTISVDPTAADYEWQFPTNTPIEGPPLQIIDGSVVKFSPGEFHNQSLPEGYKMNILMGNMAQEPISIMKPNLTSWGNRSVIEEYLSPRVYSFTKKKSSTKELLDMYWTPRPSEKFTPRVITPYYVYSLLTADVILSCDTTSLAYQFNAAKSSAMKAFSYIVSQPLVGNGKQTWYPEHAFDTFVLFDFKYLKTKDPKFLPSESDEALKKNLRQTFKKFIYSDASFEDKNRGKTIEFWNATTVRTWDWNYHGKECAYLKQNGFLKHTWGNRGKWDT